MATAEQNREKRVQHRKNKECFSEIREEKLPTASFLDTIIGIWIDGEAEERLNLLS